MSMDHTSPGQFGGAQAPPSLRLEDRIYQELRSRIQSGTYTLGDKLPPELELAAQFGVSRPVVRAALARLRDDGLIVSRQGAGSFVDTGRYRDITGFTPLRSIEDIVSYWSFRKLVECEAAACAALRRNEDQIERLRQIHHDLGVAIENEGSTVDLNTKLHITIAETAGNHFFVDAIKLLMPHMDFVGKFLRSLSSETYFRGKRGMQEEHGAIVEAIAAGDADAARRGMENHLGSSERRVFKGE